MIQRDRETITRNRTLCYRVECNDFEPKTQQSKHIHGIRKIKYTEIRKPKQNSNDDVQNAERLRGRILSPYLV